MTEKYHEKKLKECQADMVEQLKEENKMLREKILDQENALIELASIIAEG